MKRAIFHKPGQRLGIEDFRRAIAALDAGHVEPRAMVTDTISLAALPDMLETLRTDKSRCRVMVTPN